MFIFTAKSSQIFNVQENEVVKNLPDLVGEYRTYPNTGSSVLLPLSADNNWKPSVLICGGGSQQSLLSATDPSCGRIDPLDDKAAW